MREKLLELAVKSAAKCLDESRIITPQCMAALAQGLPDEVFGREVDRRLAECAAGKAPKK